MSEEALHRLQFNQNLISDDSGNTAMLSMGQLFCRDVKPLLPLNPLEAYSIQSVVNMTPIWQLVQGVSLDTIVPNVAAVANSIAAPMDIHELHLVGEGPLEEICRPIRRYVEEGLVDGGKPYLSVKDGADLREAPLTALKVAASRDNGPSVPIAR